MKFYEDSKSKNIFAFEMDGSQDHLITVDMVPYVKPEAEVLVEAKEQHTFSILNEYQTSLDAGITYNGSTFQSDPASIAALSETLTASQNGWGIPANFMWFDVDNLGHVADLAFLKGLAIALADHKSALFTRLQTAKASISTATITELNTIEL